MNRYAFEGPSPLTMPILELHVGSTNSSSESLEMKLIKATPFYPLFPRLYEVYPESPTIVNIMRTIYMTRYNLAAKESGLECTCMNNDDFTVLISGGGRHH